MTPVLQNQRPIVNSKKANRQGASLILESTLRVNMRLATAQKTTQTQVSQVNLQRQMKMSPRWHRQPLIGAEFDMTAIRQSIDSGITVRPDWVKNGSDFVRWMKLRKEERLNGNQS